MVPEKKSVQGDLTFSRKQWGAIRVLQVYNDVSPGLPCPSNSVTQRTDVTHLPHPLCHVQDKYRKPRLSQHGAMAGFLSKVCNPCLRLQPVHEGFKQTTP
jgi:hypothetical protein